MSHPTPTPPIPGVPDAAYGARYQALLTETPDDLRGTLSSRFKEKNEFITVRGFLVDALDRSGLMMEDQIQAVRSLGCTVRKVQGSFDSENAPDVNAVEIARVVKSASLPVVLITHSKGSVDTLTALVNYPEIRQKIAGWVSIQGAVQGSPVADFIVGRPAGHLSIDDALLRTALSTIFEFVFKGSLASLDALRTSDRVEYLRANADAIRAIMSGIPTIAFGSAAPTDRSKLRKVTDPFFSGEPRNDGLVSVERSVIPGARIVHDLDGPDHGDAVMDIPGPQNWDRIRLTYALLGLLE